MRNKKSEWAYRLMTLPGLLLLLLFCYVPMGGIIMAFENYVPSKGMLGSPWVGLKNFQYLFSMPDVFQVISNTVIIAVAKMILGIVVPVAFAILLNEVRSIAFRRVVQTIVYLPNFISWVILGTIFQQMFSANGLINTFVQSLGFEAIPFLSSGPIFRILVILTDCWKGFGFGTIVYLSAILGISPDLYEAATIDGANRLQRILHVTLPGMLPTIVLMGTLSLGNVLNAGFDQIFNMYNIMVYDYADIIDTYVYRMGLISMQYSLSTAVNLFKSVVSCGLTVTAYALASKFANYRIF